MFRRRARLTAAIAAALVVAGLSLSPGSASAAGGLSATFTKTSDWGTGYEASYRIANAGTVGGVVSAGGGGADPPAHEAPLIRQLAGATNVPV